MKNFEEIYSLKELQEVVEWLSNYFKRSIIIENAQFELVAYNTPNEFLLDPIQQKTILTKRCPLFVIERLKTEGIINRLKTERLPIRMESMERSEEHTSELQSRGHLVCRLLLEKKNI